MTGRSDICCGRFGTSFEAKRWLSLDPCGLVCITFSFSVHGFALAVIALFLIQHSVVSRSIFYAVYCPAAFMALWSLHTAWTTNPGAVPFGARPLTTVKKAGGGQKQRSIRRCAKCNDNYKPPRAHHDSVTGRCIVKMDHYCPWVCNAVGALNHKFFVLFIGYTLLTSLLSLVLIIIRILQCGYSPGENIDAKQNEGAWTAVKESANPFGRNLEDINTECDHLYDYYLVIVLSVISFAFMIFTCCMLFEQVEAIESNQGKIARMKMKIGQGGTELERVTYDFNEMFGGTTAGATWHWFLPLQVTFPDNMRKVVLGYEWDPTFATVYQEDDLVAAVVGDGGKDDMTDEGDVEKGMTPKNEDKEKKSPHPLRKKTGSDPGKQDRSHMKKRAPIKKLEDKPDFIDRSASID